MNSMNSPTDAIALAALANALTNLDAALAYAIADASDPLDNAINAINAAIDAINAPSNPYILTGEELARTEAAAKRS